LRWINFEFCYTFASQMAEAFNGVSCSIPSLSPEKLNSAQNHAKLHVTISYNISTAFTVSWYRPAIKYA